MATAGRRAMGGSFPPRERLKTELVRFLGKDLDGALTSLEMRPVVDRVGFTGTDQEWREEYE
eukprot:10998248-Lingulodinium_polyedra.AAC.1